MSTNLLASKITFTEESLSVRPIQGAATSVVGAIGLAERGPIGVATLVNSFEEYVQIFGSFGANYDLTLAAQTFFDNGGSTLWVVRVAHYTDVTDGTSTTATAATTASIMDTAGTPAARATFAGKTPGTYAAGLSVVVDVASSGRANEMNITVMRAGRAVENFPNVSALVTAPNYFLTIVNGTSNLIKATDVNPAGTTALAAGTTALTGGGDGLASLADADFIGSQAGGTGLRAFDKVDDLTVLIAPGRATAAMHNAMISYCEGARFGKVFTVLDPPSGLTAQGIKTYVNTTASIKELSEFAAIYWPRVLIANPNAAIYGNTPTIAIPPSGAIAGLYARNDARPGGVYEAPAGIDNNYGVLFNVLGLETDEVRDETKRDIVFPELINPIVGIKGQPIHLDGARTLKSTSNFPTIGERRGMIFIERSLETGLMFAKHRKIKTSTLQRMQRTSVAFFLSQLRLDAFASDVPSEAFTVDFGAGLNPPSEKFARRINGRFGVATAKPGEYIVLRAGQDTRALEAELNKATA